VADRSAVCVRERNWRVLVTVTQQEAVKLVEGYTLTNKARLEAMYAALKKVRVDGIAGDIVECGVWQGGNIIMARKVLPDRTCWLYDTFTGMTQPGPEDVKRTGTRSRALNDPRWIKGESWCEASLAAVQDNMARTGTLDFTVCRFIAGDVTETLLDPVLVPKRIALLRLDTDFYASTKIELEVLYPRLSPGGVLIVDDYGHWWGCRKAFKDYFGKKTPNFTQIDYSAIMLVKP
jgi:O-methyltransferase